MEETSENKPIKHICIGLLAHVDAGKTTLSEAMLYEGGKLRSMGRVDKGSAFLDTHELERKRGITIFSKQAVLTIEDRIFTLLDTPGHVDFSAEMERTLEVLDCAILVISGTEGVQAHTVTLWQLLKRYEIPVFIFINKMDREEADRTRILEELHQKLGEEIVDFSGDNILEFYENAALSDEETLRIFLETGTIPDEMLRQRIAERKIFPCFFGSALRCAGVNQFLQGIVRFSKLPDYSEKFGARIFKITRDDQGMRLTHMKITGGSIAVKAILPGMQGKVNQIRIYSGDKYEVVLEALPGRICAVAGLEGAKAGMGVGIEVAAVQPVLSPVLNYRLDLPKGTDPRKMLDNLRGLEEEEPMLRIRWSEKLQEIHAALMGEVQIEVLKSLITDRFHVPVQFASPNIVYKETITSVVEGVGHFEPLRHYAEVHLILEPGPQGTGLVFETKVSEDQLSGNWQRLVLTHLEEKDHLGTLTGSSITDMKITLVAGRAHKKHTEGGDFRQATYRAVRQGLMEAKSVLLEPWYKVSVKVPEDMVGRVMSDMERMKGQIGLPLMENGYAVLTGKVPVVCLQGYQQELSAYSRGLGRIAYTFGGYETCHNEEEVIAAAAYNPESDTENPPGSVFCSGGTGFQVPWNQVKEYMHVESCLTQFVKEEGQCDSVSVGNAVRHEEQWIDTEEVDRILARTYEANKKEKVQGRFTRQKIKVSAPVAKPTVNFVKKRQQYLLVDGYNIIYAWKDLKELAEDNIDAARGRLLDILSNYQAIRGGELMVVFDAYRMQRHVEEVLTYHNIFVVYTRETQTADQYIERFAHDNRHQYDVTVATSDCMEQVITRGQGCALFSARELEEEVKRVNKETLENYAPPGRAGINPFSDALTGADTSK